VTMTKELDAAAHAWQVIIHCADSVKGRQTTLGVCRACHRDDVPNVPSDRIRSGYCSACFKAWTRTDHGNGRMDRLAFEHTRQLPTVEAS
jgi:hypothetical protein